MNETCKILNCDRASVFLLDAKKNELWTKVAKGTGTIRVPVDEGIVGFVAKSNDILNIYDAHTDYRCNFILLIF
jgi:hypothetical protein